MTKDTTTTSAALEALARGYQPIPLLTKGKRPTLPGWSRMRWDPADPGFLRRNFEAYTLDGMTNLGLLLGEPSGGLVDVDIDHPKASRLMTMLLPHTAMKTGRGGRRSSHWWYRCKPGTLPATRQHLMPRTPEGNRGEVTIELRSTGAQTVIPPSLHLSDEAYIWEGEPWGGDEGPTLIDGRLLATQVALIGLGAVLLETWPTKGSRHEAYLALAGALLSYGDQAVHPYWERNARVLIRTLATAAFDDDGPDARERESINSTIEAIRAGKHVYGYGKLSEILGQPAVDQVRLLVAEVESAAGFSLDQPPTAAADPGPAQSPDGATETDDITDPMDARSSSWEPIDLDPYLSGRVKVVEPYVLRRSDGAALLYPGLVNMFYGSSESAKSWMALYTCLESMGRGERVVYLDFEDGPDLAVSRLLALGADPDDVRTYFTYIRPDDALASMQWNRYGKPAITDKGTTNQGMLDKVLIEVDPTLVVVDGMSVLYGLHGLDTNDTSQTNVITTWLIRLTRSGRTTVAVVDHTVKNGERGSLPIGSQHKVSMVQGTLLQVWPVKKPMPGAVGELEILVLKDRRGLVRGSSPEGGANNGQKVQVCAVVTMDSTIDGEVHMTLNPPPDLAPGGPQDLDLSQVREAQRAEVMRAVEESIKWCYQGRLGHEMTLHQLVDLNPSLTQKQVDAGIKRLIEQGWLEPQGNTRGRTYRLLIGGAGYDEAPL